MHQKFRILRGEIPQVLEDLGLKNRTSADINKTFSVIQDIIDDCEPYRRKFGKPILKNLFGSVGRGSKTTELNVFPWDTAESAVEYKSLPHPLHSPCT